MRRFSGIPICLAGDAYCFCRLPDVIAAAGGGVEGGGGGGGGGCDYCPSEAVIFMQTCWFIA